jgi:hypothetical protein
VKKVSRPASALQTPCRESWLNRRLVKTFVTDPMSNTVSPEGGMGEFMSCRPNPCEKMTSWLYTAITAMPAVMFRAAKLRIAWEHPAEANANAVCTRESVESLAHGTVCSAGRQEGPPLPSQEEKVVKQPDVGSPTTTRGRMGSAGKGGKEGRFCARLGASNARNSHIKKVILRSKGMHLIVSYIIIFCAPNTHSSEHCMSHRRIAKLRECQQTF